MMPKKAKIKNIIIGLLVFFIIIIGLILLLAKFSSGKGMDYFEKNYTKNSEEWDKIAREFLKQNEIKNIQTYYGILKSWESVNNCSRHGDYGKNAPFVCTEGIYPNNTYVYLNTLDEVLEYQGIRRETYDHFYNFMKKYKLRGMGKSIGEHISDTKGPQVDFSDLLCGIIFYENTDDTLKENIEYLSVKKINDHWYTYYRDWN